MGGWFSEAVECAISSTIEWLVGYDRRIEKLDLNVGYVLPEFRGSHVSPNKFSVGVLKMINAEYTEIVKSFNRMISDGYQTFFVPEKDLLNGLKSKELAEREKRIPPLWRAYCENVDEHELKMYINKLKEVRKSIDEVDKFIENNLGLEPNCKLIHDYEHVFQLQNSNETIKKWWGLQEELIYTPGQVEEWKIEDLQEAHTNVAPLIEGGAVAMEALFLKDKNWIKKRYREVDLCIQVVNQACNKVLGKNKPNPVSIKEYALLIYENPFTGIELYKEL